MHADKDVKKGYANKSVGERVETKQERDKRMVGKMDSNMKSTQPTLVNMSKPLPSPHAFTSGDLPHWFEG